MTLSLNTFVATTAPTAACLPRAQSRGGFAIDPRAATASHALIPQNVSGFPTISKIASLWLAINPPKTNPNFTDKAKPITPLALHQPGSCPTLTPSTMTKRSQRASLPPCDPPVRSRHLFVLLTPSPPLSPMTRSDFIISLALLCAATVAPAQTAPAP